MRVWRSGKSFAHPLLVLIIKSGKDPNSRFAVTAGKAIGNAVKRNRAKRLLRAALQQHIQDIPPGIQGLIIARKPLLQANSQQAAAALGSLLREAGLKPGN
jgi:ribonuclease P protein component